MDNLFGLVTNQHFTYVPKKWGHELWIVNKQYCGKLLHLKKDKRLSFHYHKQKDETFYVAKGKLTVKFGETDDMEKAKEFELTEGMKFYVPVGLRHQLIAHEDSDVFEFSTTHYDSDSYRVVPGD